MNENNSFKGIHEKNIFSLKRREKVFPVHMKKVFRCSRTIKLLFASNEIQLSVIQFLQA